MAKLQGWSYGKLMKVPANSIDADLPYFPCPVYLNSSNFDFSKCKADGSDIRFTDKNLNFLKHERVEHSQGTQFAKYNVLLPKVSDLTDTEFYMWYGNPNAYNTSIEAWQDMTGKQLTYNGNVKLVPNVARFGKAAYFDGTGDYISIPYSDDWHLAGGDFCIDFWYNPTTSGDQRIMTQGTVSTTLINLIINNSTGSISFYSNNTNSPAIATTSPAFVWVNKLKHIEISRTGNNAYIFSDGILIATVDVTGKYFTDLADPLLLMKLNYETGYYGTGYLDEFRFRKGIGGHTSNFIPPQEPYTVDANTKLLLHFDSAPFTDECGKTVTTYGDVKPIKTAYADGARSAYFDGTGDYFNLGGQTDFAYGTGDYCIEIIYAPMVSGAEHVLFDSRPANTEGAYACLYRNTANVLVFNLSSATRITGTTPLVAGNLYRVKLERISGVTKLYLNDVQEGSSYTDTTNYINGANRPTIGASGNNAGVSCVNGYILGCRVTKGRARVGALMPYLFAIDGSDVVFCTNFDTVYSQDYAMVQHMGDSLVDATGNGNNGTAIGTTVVSTEYGKVRQFNGSSDYITVGYGILTAISPYTINTLAYLKGSKTFADIFGKTNSTSLRNTANPYIALETYNSTLVCDIGGGGSSAGTTTTDIVINSYNSVAGKFDGLNAKIFVGGLLKNTSPNATPSGNLGQPAYIGYGGVATTHFDSIIAELRLATIARPDAYIKAESKALKNELLIVTDYVDTLALFGLMF